MKYHFAAFFLLVTSDKFCYRQHAQIGSREATLDRSIYEYCDLTDGEILEREKRLAGERAKEIAKERKRVSKASNFHFRGGML
jgi:hypothetical protein